MLDRTWLANSNQLARPVAYKKTRFWATERLLNRLLVAPTGFFATKTALASIANLS